MIAAAGIRTPTVELNLPAGIERKLRRTLGRYLGIPGVQQWVGEVTAALVAGAVGFESTDLAMQRTGFDAVMWHPAAQKFLVLEAKGGRHAFLAPGQMSKRWIDRARSQVVNDPRNFSSGHVDDFDRAKTMWAMVVKVDLLNSPNLAAKIQNYPWVRRWGQPFDKF